MRPLSTCFQKYNKLTSCQFAADLPPLQTPPNEMPVAALASYETRYDSFADMQDQQEDIWAATAAGEPDDDNGMWGYEADGFVVPDTTVDEYIPI